MQRRIFVGFFILLLGAAHPLCAQTPESNYTITLPDKQKIAVAVSVRNNRDGGRAARIVSRAPSAGTPAPLLMDVTAETNADGVPLRSQIALGVDAANPARFEARRTPEGEYAVGMMEERRTLPFGATLVSAQTAQMFLGRLYKFDKGGEQSFALFVDYGWKPLEIVTLNLRADGTEVIELTEGKVTARRLRYEAAISHIAKVDQKGVFYIGPLGEILRCDTAALGLPFKLRGPVKREETKRLVGAIAVPIDTLKILLKAERDIDGYNIAVRLNDQPFGPKTSCDLNYLPTRIESNWLGRAMTAVVAENQVQCVLAATPPEVSAAPSNHPWFIPHWIVTELWEGETGQFKGMKVGEKREGDFLPLVSGLVERGPFTIARQPDAKATLGEGTVTVFCYRLQSAKQTYQLYTDGSRLFVCQGSDGFRVVRDGWESYADALKPPTAPTPAKTDTP